MNRFPIQETTEGKAGGTTQGQEEGSGRVQQGVTCRELQNAHQEELYLRETVDKLNIRIEELEKHGEEALDELKRERHNREQEEARNDVLQRRVYELEQTQLPLLSSSCGRQELQAAAKQIEELQKKVYVLEKRKEQAQKDDCTRQQLQHDYNSAKALITDLKAEKDIAVKAYQRSQAEHEEMRIKLGHTHTTLDQCRRTFRRKKEDYQKQIVHLNAENAKLRREKQNGEHRFNVQPVQPVQSPHLRGEMNCEEEEARPDESPERKRKRSRFQWQPCKARYCKNCRRIFDRDSPGHVKCRFHLLPSLPYHGWKDLKPTEAGEARSKDQRYWPCCDKLSRCEPDGCRSIKDHELEDLDEMLSNNSDLPCLSSSF